MSGIVINIKAGATKRESTATATGRLEKAFGNFESAESGAVFDRAVLEHYNLQPNDANRRTPWLKAWTVAEPTKVEILDVTSDTSIFARDSLKNDSDATVTYSSKLSHQVTNSVSSQWSQTTGVSVGQSINFKLDILKAGAAAQTSFNFKHDWGKNETKTQGMTLGKESALSVPLKPRQWVIAELSASAGRMRVRITYEVYIKGETTATYDPTKYEHKFFVGLPLEMILKGNPKTKITEEVEVGYHFNSSITVKNAK